MSIETRFEETLRLLTEQTKASYCARLFGQRSQSPCSVTTDFATLVLRHQPDGGLDNPAGIFGALSDLRQCKCQESEDSPKGPVPYILVAERPLAQYLRALGLWGGKSPSESVTRSGPEVSHLASPANSLVWK